MLEVKTVADMIEFLKGQDPDQEVFVVLESHSKDEDAGFSIDRWEVRETGIALVAQDVLEFGPPLS